MPETRRSDSHPPTDLPPRIFQLSNQHSYSFPTNRKASFEVCLEARYGGTVVTGPKLVNAVAVTSAAHTSQTIGNVPFPYGFPKGMHAIPEFNHPGKSTQELRSSNWARISCSRVLASLIAVPSSVSIYTCLIPNHLRGTLLPYPPNRVVAGLSGRSYLSQLAGSLSRCELCEPRRGVRRTPCYQACRSVRPHIALLLPPSTLTWIRGLGRDHAVRRGFGRPCSAASASAPPLLPDWPSLDGLRPCYP